MQFQGIFYHKWQVSVYELLKGANIAKEEGLNELSIRIYGIFHECTQLINAQGMQNIMLKWNFSEKVGSGSFFCCGFLKN